jgi:hypothetical protein
MHGSNVNYIIVWLENLKGKRPLREHRHSWKGNTEMGEDIVVLPYDWLKFLLLLLKLLT